MSAGYDSVRAFRTLGVKITPKKVLLSQSSFSPEFRKLGDRG